MKTMVIAAGLVLVGSTANAAEPILKPPGASCPERYEASGSYCMPLHGAMQVIRKADGGACPSGTHQSGRGFCEAFHDDAAVISRPSGATCPSGWRASGSGCIR